MPRIQKKGKQTPSLLPFVWLQGQIGKMLNMSYQFVEQYRHGEVSFAKMSQAVMIASVITTALVYAIRELYRKGEKYLLQGFAKWIGIKGKEGYKYDERTKTAVDRSLDVTCEVVGNFPVIGPPVGSAIQSLYYKTRYGESQNLIKDDVISMTFRNLVKLSETFAGAIAATAKGEKLKKGPMKGDYQAVYNWLDAFTAMTSMVNVQAGRLSRGVLPSLKGNAVEVFSNMFYDAVKKNDVPRALFARSMLIKYYRWTNKQLFQQRIKELSEEEKQRIREINAQGSQR
jgi:hypothetical protein